MKYLGPPQSGSIAAETFSRNQFGQYTRARTPPTQSTSSEAIAARANLAAAVALWQGLTDAQRIAWEQYAQSFPRARSLGVQAPLSGYDACVQCNLVGQQYPVPATFSDPPAFPAWTVNVLGLTWTGTAAGGPVLWTAMPNLATGNKLFVYSAGWGSAGRMRPTSAGRRLLINRVNLGFTPNNQLTPFYARFGGGPAPSGDSSFWALREVSNGVLGPEWVFRLVVP